MKIKMLVSRAGVNFSNNCGDEIEVSDNEGRRLIDAGQAVLVYTARPDQEKTEKAFKKAHTEKARK